MLNIGLMFKHYLPKKNQIIKLLSDIEREKDICFYLLGEATTEMIPKDKNIPHNTDSENDFKIDYIFCFGGDGTILRSVEYSILHNAPVLGVNFGKLGFLSDSTIREIRHSIDELQNGNFHLEKRMMLDIYVYRNKELIYSDLSLNEAVLSKGIISKLIKIRLYANRHFVYETRSDGMIISTPTGSTAYSLSAGGPIILPTMEAILVTALNPHAFTIRPMVFAGDTQFEIRIPIDNEVYLQTDGKNRYLLQHDDKIIIRKSLQSLKFIKLKNKTFYKLLRKKLYMGKI